MDREYVMGYQEDKRKKNIVHRNQQEVQKIKFLLRFVCRFLLLMVVVDSN
jgi:hypothetical protein